MSEGARPGSSTRSPARSGAGDLAQANGGESLALQAQFERRAQQTAPCLLFPLVPGAHPVQQGPIRRTVVLSPKTMTFRGNLRNSDFSTGFSVYNC
jgi:hypothetical protein